MKIRNSEEVSGETVDTVKKDVHDKGDFLPHRSFYQSKGCVSIQTENGAAGLYCHFQSIYMHIFLTDKNLIYCVLFFLNLSTVFPKTSSLFIVQSFFFYYYIYDICTLVLSLSIQ